MSPYSNKKIKFAKLFVRYYKSFFGKRMAESNSQNCIKILKVFDLAFTINSNEILI